MSGGRNLLYYEDRESRSKVTDEHPGNRERDLEHTQRAKPRDHVSVHAAPACGRGKQVSRTVRACEAGGISEFHISGFYLANASAAKEAFNRRRNKCGEISRAF